ncbi:MAG: hypothetical protein U0359_37285 [Byssovorax sp.]
MKRWPVLCLAALAFAGSEPRARADEPKESLAAPPTQLGAKYSRYEQDSIDRAVQKLGAAVDPAPEGKTIEDVKVTTLDVFEKRDFIPNFLLGLVNWFHVTSRPYVIERELLVSRGQPYSARRVDETARNLRGLGQLSVVLAVPLRGSSPDKVVLLLVTKDVWSLRLNSDYLVAGGKLQYLLLQPSEENFLGTHQSLLGNFILDPATYTFGGRYIIPRLGGSRIKLDVSGNAVVNRSTGAAEGGYGTLIYGQPLYSTEAIWAWGAKISVREDIKRRFVGGDLAPFPPGTDTALHQEYHRDVVSGRFDVTRSFGAAIKNNLLFGFGASRNVYRPPAALASASDEVKSAFYAQVMPVSDTQIGPYVELHSFQNRYMTLLDFNTLGLQEDYLSGHDAYLRLTPITTWLGSSRTFLSVYAAAAYTIPLGDGLVRGFVETSNELTTSGVPDGSIEAGLRIASPRTKIGRLHFDARFLNRYANYLNERSFLGGDTRPRGYASQAFGGKDMVTASLELRSRAVQILGCQLAGAAFVDTGDAFDGFRDLKLKPSAGLGARVLFPQLDRVVMRVDLGFPFVTCPGKCSYTTDVLPKNHAPDVVLTFKQAFEMPVIPTGN